MGLPPATDAGIEDLIKVVNNFGDAEPRPSGLRARFLVEFLADTGDDPTARAILGVVLLFMEASVPKYLQPWLGGGRLVGIGKNDAPLDVDARPLVVGEVWRRIAGKLCLAGDREGLAGWLRPHQLAVGTPAGVEAIVHALRQWWDRNKAAGNTKAVLVKEDYSNAFNTAEPEAFLASGRRKMPGSARLANWCWDSNKPKFIMVRHTNLTGGSRAVH